MIRKKIWLLALLLLALSGIAFIWRKKEESQSDMGDFILNPDVENFIKSEEGFRHNVYKDLNGNLTIGWGHMLTSSEIGKLTYVTKEQAQDLFNKDISIPFNYLKKQSYYSRLNRNQISALISFIFNIGTGSFSGSTLHKKLKENASINEIESAFYLWHKPNLLERRKREFQYFIKPV